MLRTYFSAVTDEDLNMETDLVYSIEEKIFYNSLPNQMMKTQVDFKQGILDQDIDWTGQQQMLNLRSQ